MLRVEADAKGVDQPATSSAVAAACGVDQAHRAECGPAGVVVDDEHRRPVRAWHRPHGGEHAEALAGPGVEGDTRAGNGRRAQHRRGDSSPLTGQEVEARAAGRKAAARDRS